MKASSRGVRDRGSDLICASSLSPPVRHNYLSPELSGTSNSSQCLCLWQPSSFYCYTHACTSTIKTWSQTNNYSSKLFFSISYDPNSFRLSYNKVTVGFVWCGKTDWWKNVNGLDLPTFISFFFLQKLLIFNPCIPKKKKSKLCDCVSMEQCFNTGIQFNVVWRPGYRELVFWGFFYINFFLRWSRNCEFTSY